MFIFYRPDFLRFDLDCAGGVDGCCCACDCCSLEARLFFELLDVDLIELLSNLDLFIDDVAFEFDVNRVDKLEPLFIDDVSSRSSRI